MKKTLTCLLALGFVANAQAQNIRVDLDGQNLAGEPPIRQAGRVLVPLRGIFEALGAEVKFDSATKAIRAQRDSTIVELTLGQTLARVAGKSIQLEVPALVQQGKTFVPLRFVAEAFGAQVSWDGPNSRVSITSASEPGFNPNIDLPRLTVGHQGGILKVWDRARQKEVFHRGIDDRSIARYDSTSRDQLFAALAIDPSRLQFEGERLMARTPTKEAIALLGAIGSHPDLSPAFRARLQDFVSRQMSLHQDVVIRRQSLLALAIMDQPQAQTVEAVTGAFERSSNLWETFPVQQFFEYHSGQVRALPNYPQVRQRLSKVASLYTPYVLGYLDSAAEIRPRFMDSGNVGY